MPILNSNTQLVFTASTFILWILSILAIILHISVLISVSWGSLGVTETIHFDYKDFGTYVLPEHLDKSSSKLALASSVISLIISTAFLAFFTGYWTKNKRARLAMIYAYLFSPVSIFRLALLFNTLLSFIAVTYLHISYIQSATYDPECTYRGHYHEGTFDFEVWTCQVVKYSGTYSDGKCRDARAGRVVQILSFVVAVVVMGAGGGELREEGRRGERVGLDGLDGGVREKSGGVAYVICGYRHVG
ncbi:uncharacterized protein Bfra_000747 [Botrytis fragariae]|uniref:Uncharacterized protein n=1 Tax=Botrytis fragariae TaxID=1964551 RepID=A0A8H6ENN6_9HELO|nr:uncharacterized protein Bfra_000747 [Botrytis fragariae]KAF5878580.1 hypothetical protein Bfra_000747 [Botrytis fragariae]